MIKVNTMSWQETQAFWNERGYACEIADRKTAQRIIRSTNAVVFDDWDVPVITPHGGYIQAWIRGEDANTFAANFEIDIDHDIVQWYFSMDEQQRESAGWAYWESSLDRLWHEAFSCALAYVADERTRT